MLGSPGICLSPPLQNLSSENGVLDRLLDDSTIPQLIDVFLERLQQSTPFFTRSFLRQNIARQRHLQGQSFCSLVQAICSLVLLQPIQSQEKRSWPNLEARADAHLALAVNLHSQSDLGQSPILETIMTSVFLFACQFCKGNFDAARFRLREAAALAEVMNLDKPESYSKIGDTEKQRRLRTLIGLTIIERIYSVQGDYVPGTKLLSRNKLQELQNAIASSDERTENTHAQHADILVTRHCIRIKLWALSSSHGLIEALPNEEEFRNEYALTITSEALDTCSQFEMASLEIHGVVLVEKLSDIATCAALQVNEPYATYSPNREYPTDADSTGIDTSEMLPQEDSPNSMSSLGPLKSGAEEMLNGYLALFASFRRGKRPFLKLYMCLLPAAIVCRAKKIADTTPKLLTKYQ
ncbi:hypothetical protein FGADI_7661 [Fusarium gaditjirri]|uniref:Uncharacterized protein n=1 Tax=Fusarium gaditjirri TaxID=282569 RepID=A0A8H4T4H2_9HYPO|nr:hypothetical protein FGADI_7661 [Fusarium gaditjirri]